MTEVGKLWLRSGRVRGQKAWGANENKTKNFALTSDVERERMQEK